MLKGRERELAYLNKEYQSGSDRLLVVYGQKDVGKTALLAAFMEDKTAFYYQAEEGSERQQLYLLGRQLQRLGSSLPLYPAYEEVFQCLEQQKLLVIDEFQYLLKAGDGFVQALDAFLQNKNDSCMVLLCSSSVSFVENHMVAKMGRLAHKLTGFLKLRELQLWDVAAYFPDYSWEDCVKVYSILGGMPGLWQTFDASVSVSENICRVILAQGGRLHEEGARIVGRQLRECGVYFSILGALAQGKNKLNELYQHTGFSRAKISVYLKNLMELELVEKVFSLDTPGRDNQRKAVYRISHPLVRFWFCFLYADSSLLLRITPEAYYEQLVKPALTLYCESCFSKVCQEYMQREAAAHALPIEITEFGSFVGKAGSIDYIGHDDNGQYIVAFADYKDPVFPYEKYLQAKALTGQAGIRPDYMYLFSGHGFDAKLEALDKELDTLILIRMDDL